MAAGAVILDIFFGGQCGFPFFLKGLFAAETFIGVAFSQHFCSGLGVVFFKFSLEIGTFVPVNAEPVETVNDALNGLFCRALCIGVFNAEDEFAIMFFGIEPVDNSCAGTANMKIACGAGWETDADFRHCLLLNI